MGSNVPWNYVILDALRHGEADLSDIYQFIEANQAELAKLETDYIDHRLLEPDLRWGPRPKYQHTVRGIISVLKKRGLVERVERARYRLTDLGQEMLKDYDSVVE